MKEYIPIYRFQVLDHIEKGKKVYCLDRETLDTFLVNNISVASVFKLIEESETEKTRFEFWYKQEVEEQESAE